MLSLTPDEFRILKVLDNCLKPSCVRASIDQIVARVERQLEQDSTSQMAWEPIPLSVFGDALPLEIQSSWVFILRAGATTGAERHPNSHQRVTSYRGSGDLQVRVDDAWQSSQLVSKSDAQLARRWASIPANVWHQAVVPGENWIVVSFHTVAAHELIEERPQGQDWGSTRSRTYVNES
jgi:hypothetical protein